MYWCLSLCLHFGFKAPERAAAIWRQNCETVIRCFQELLLLSHIGCHLRVVFGLWGMWGGARRDFPSDFHVMEMKVSDKVVKLDELFP